MVERVGMRGNVIDYILSAGKGRCAIKQMQKAKIQEISVEEKYKSFSSKKNNNKGQGF